MFCRCKNTNLSTTKKLADIRPPDPGCPTLPFHYSDGIMSAVASQITSVLIVYSTVYSGAGQRRHQSSASLPFMRGIHRWPVNSPHNGPVTWKMFPFNDVIMCSNAIRMLHNMIHMALVTVASAWWLLMARHIKYSRTHARMRSYRVWVPRCDGLCHSSRNTYTMIIMDWM